ncbi:MAG: glycosyltransferase [Lachnospiraceae bacterium]
MEKNNYSLPRGQYFFLWGGLVKNAGGMTRVMLDRICRFKRDGIQPVVLLGARGLAQKDNVEAYRNEGYAEVVREDFISLEEFLDIKLTDKTVIIEDENYLIQKSSDSCILYSDNMNEIYKDGMIISKQYYKDNKELQRVEHFTVDDFNIPYKIEYYYRGRKNKAIIGIKDSLFYENYYGDNGYCFMSLLNEKKENTTREISAKLFNQRTKEVLQFNNLSEVREYFYSSYVMENYNDDTYVFCDPILDLEPGFRFMHENTAHKLYKIAINHGIGFAPPRDWNSNINPRFTRYIDVASASVDALVLLTEKAKLNAIKRFGNRNIFYCIPNTVKLNTYLTPPEERNMKKAVFVGRFSSEKQCEHIIKAFSLVLKEIPDVVLELYGRGDSEPAMHKLIDEMSLNGKVIIKGFSTNVQEVFSKACFSVITSGYNVESFCLSLTESLASGCPVVTYDMKFGASYVIEEGKNGFIVEPDNINKLAEIMIYIFNNPEKTREMYKNSYNSARMFDENLYFNNWVKTINKIVDEHDYRQNIRELQVTVDDVVYTKRPDKYISIKGSIKIDGVTGKVRNAERIYFRKYNDKKSDYKICLCKFNKISAKEYLYEGKVDGNINSLSICFEWENVFSEVDISNEIF